MNLKKRFKDYFVDEFLGVVSAWTMDKALQAKALQQGIKIKIDFIVESKLGGCL